MKKTLAGCGFAVLAAFAMSVGAGLAEEAVGRSSVTDADLAASPLARLAKAIEDGDARTVAEFVLFPLERETPIPAIRDADEFVARFPLLFDEEFREQMRAGSFSEDWEEVGWRGTMYRDGAVWVDGSLAAGGKLYRVNYQSKAETRMRAALVDAERRTLPEAISGICDPVFCFQTHDGETFGRVDRMGGGDFRIVLFDGTVAGPRPLPPSALKVKTVFFASAEYEGSGGDHTFLDRLGRSALRVNWIGSFETPDLELFERNSWMDAAGQGKPAKYRPWKELVETPDAVFPGGEEPGEGERAPQSDTGSLEAM